MPLFSMDLQTVIQMVPNFINFVILSALMSYLLYNPVKRVLQNRADRVANELKEAVDKNVKANEMYADYEQKIKDIEMERVAILDKARKDAIEQRESIIETAKSEAQELKDRANRDIVAERERVKDEVHHAIIEISADMAEKLIAATIDKNAHSKLFDEAMSDLESTVFRPVAQTV